VKRFLIFLQEAPLLLIFFALFAPLRFRLSRFLPFTVFESVFIRSIRLFRVPLSLIFSYLLPAYLA